MRIPIVLFMVLFACGLAAAQDGSDMQYFESPEVTTKLVGRRVHIDFYRKWDWHVRNFNRDEGPLDTVVLEIDGKQREFREHREDDGYNNWFRDQYLESADKKIRITEFELIEVGKDTLKVRAKLTAEPFSKEFVFEKKDIAQVLVKSDW